MSSKKLSLVSRLTLGNILIVSIVLGLSGFTMYQFACQLVGDMNGVNQAQQQSFNQTLFGFVVMILFFSIIFGGLFYFYFVKKVVTPIQRLADSTEELIKGEFPTIPTEKHNNEISRLTRNFQRLSDKLKTLEESRAQIVSTTAHELRTPLSNINGYLEGLKKGVITGNEALYDALHKESVRLIHMVDELYKLSEWEIESTGGLQKEKLNMKRLMEQVIILFQWELEEKGIHVAMNMETEQVWGDREQLQQVLINFIQNAVEHQQTPSPISIQGVREAHYYTVYVEVEGKPISSHEKNKIFERYFYKKGKKQASSREKGIGLAIVKEVIEKHGGLFGLETDGTSHQFWFSLPITNES
ncbi:two-component system, OmpR family, sensor histidine kinase BaeS [Alteribacillus persepolensis]|uniref:histidine kinase n=1 Tax=Alteribacillus persepolensis TaxID=568899 RepID=A0A1G8FW96_9BACI|nr:HAMP domain-containing sensor histidine kinase [Alteribacillus persepolensis]SDH86434.1 two-component system, OmpR family, sensor histidine kinase BaeS [Alteribacillus persepolensis]